MERNICEKILNLISDTHNVRYPVSLSSRLFVFRHMDTPFIYRSVTSETPASPGSSFFLCMEEAEKLVRAQTGMKASSARGRLSTAAARGGGLQDVGKREAPPVGKKGKRSREKGPQKV